MTRLREQAGTASKRTMDAADIELYIARMNVVCVGETKLAAAIRDIDREYSLTKLRDCDGATSKREVYNERGQRAKSTAFHPGSA